MCTCGKVVLSFGIVGVALLIAGLVIGFSAVLDGYINNRIEESVRLENNTEQYERWAALPFPLQFKIYVFNVLNPDDILEGAIPEVEEVGPFVYDEYYQKENIQYDEETDTYTYTQRKTYEFNEELSAFSEDTNVTVLNAPLQGMFLTVEGSSTAGTVNNFWTGMFENDGLFLNIPAKNLFFEGYDFCVAANISPVERGICAIVKNLLADSKTTVVDSQKIRFSFFAHKNDSDDGVYQVSGGNLDVNTLGAILSWEGEQYLNTWDGENSTCNHIRGRDSAIYPPFNNESSAFDIYNTDICKVVTIRTTETTTYRDIDGIRATLDLDDMRNDGDKECYCIKQVRNLDGELECLPEGYTDMSTCLFAPVIASFPHMLWANETYSSTVKGLEPDQEKHQTFVVLQPDTGTPLQGSKRIQFNMIVRPIERIAVTTNLTNAVFPILWVEQGFSLPDDQIEVLEDQYLSKIKLLDIVSYVLIGVGAGLVILCLNVRLKGGTEQFDRWENLPIDVFYRIRMFNVTNADEVMYQDAIPIVEEVGPYIYKQTRQKKNITYHEHNDTLSYVEYVHFEFDAEASFPHTEDDKLIIVNVVLNVLFNMLGNFLPSNIQYLIDFFWKNVVTDTDNLFHSVRVGDILFDGYKFCNSEYETDDNSTDVSWLVCFGMSLMDNGIIEAEDDGSLSFAFFRTKQDKHDGIFNINAGIKDVSKLGIINSWDGRFYLNTWNGRLSWCNRVTGGDSVIYAPFMKPEDNVEIFATDLCRVAEIYYAGNEYISEIEGHRRILREDTFSISQNPNNECFCTGNRDLYNEQQCLPDGFFDLQPCLGAPIIASFPHFLHGDANYSSTVIGLNPDKESHETYAIIEPTTGTPLSGYKRIQFNAMLKPIEGVNVTQVRNAMVPILWVEEVCILYCYL
ncbi:scavenger receptor class b type-1 sr-b1 [Holotrichia oblita]|uniref:Scavenger receptor class b type-1 sr-b1 n=1 Tax=Holotrichia oblita TaxID=644536 RepID=A0ACB9TWB0_HOLOL|nr:scavenger receptor class b type-1 sr-b1 [Holotrichia oblita]